MSFLSRDRKIKKFAKTVEERDNTIFVFGSDFQTHQFIEDVIRLGLGGKVALIAEDDKNWIDEIQDDDSISVLVEKNLEKYADKKLYNLIGFSTAEKIIILHSDGQLIQNIISHIENLGGRDVKIILIAQYAPAFVKYLSQAQRDRFIITDNVTATTAELYKTLGLDLVQPPIITVPIPKKLSSTPANQIHFKQSRILRIVRTKQVDGQNELLPIENSLIEGDLIMLYLFNGEDSIREVIDYFQKE